MTYCRAPGYVPGEPKEPHKATVYITAPEELGPVANTYICGNALWFLLTNTTLKYRPKEIFLRRPKDAPKPIRFRRAKAQGPRDA